MKHGVFIHGDPYNDPLTIARFAGMVMRLASNPALQEKIRAEMIPYARERFDWEKSIDQIEGWMYGYDKLDVTTSQHLFAVKHAKGRGNILNVGCGDDAAGLRESCGAVNMDVNAVDPETGRDNAVDFVGDANYLPAPFEPHTFDVVVCCEMLEHFNPLDVPDQLWRFKRCLTPTGRIVLSIPNDHGHEPFPEDSEERRAKGFYGKHHPCPPSMVERWLKEAGLRAIHRERIEYGWRGVTGIGIVCVPNESDVQMEPARQKHSVVFLDHDPENRMVELRGRSLKALELCATTSQLTVVSDGTSWADAVNKGLDRSHGEFVHFVSNDVIIEDRKWMEKLAIPNALTAWAPRTFVLTGELTLDMALFTIHRPVFEKVGGPDEGYEHGQFGDDAWIHAVRKAGFDTKINPVRALHLKSQTIKAYVDPMEFEGAYSRAKERFKNFHPALEPSGGWLR